MKADLSIEYSEDLDNVFRDLQGADAPVQPQVDFSSREYRSLLRKFKVYQERDRADRDRPMLRLYTCYRGVPFDSPVEVLSVGEEFVDLQVTPRQARVLANRGFAMIESPIHGTAFRAFTSDVDVDKSEASFSHFVPHYNLSDLRTSMRVEPSMPIAVTLSRGTTAVTGQLIDLSDIAIAIQCHGFAATGFTEGTAIQVETTIPLAAGDCEVASTGTIAKVAPDLLGNFSEQRVVVQMSPDERVISAFSKYITQRQEEVCEELGSS